MAAAKKPKQLTEADLIKAPEGEYMNEVQLAFYRQKLMDIRAQLLNNADDTGQHLRENETTTDPSDRATLEEEYTLELRTRDRERKLLKKVEGSPSVDRRRRIFTVKSLATDRIPRLLARPTATLSLEAQERRERTEDGGEWHSAGVQARRRTRMRIIITAMLGSLGGRLLHYPRTGGSARQRLLEPTKDSTTKGTVTFSSGGNVQSPRTSPG
jgi:DnaK suppressor protein